MNKLILLFFLVLGACSTPPKSGVSSNKVTTEKPNTPITAGGCIADREMHKQRAEELQTLLAADQKARQASKIDWYQLMLDDEVRRKRVAEIFAEGCFETAKDYAAGAMIFQHGTVRDHYFFAYIWSQKALALGDKTQKWLVAATADRWLVNSGYKQFFGTQASKSTPESCWCLEPVEKTFSDKKRKDYTKKNLVEALAWVKSMNQSDPKCAKKGDFCNKSYLEAPKNLRLPGL